MSATVVDLKQRFALGLDARIVPAAAWVPLQRAQELVDQANAALQQLEGELERERANARELGAAEGRRLALDEFAEATQALAQAREQVAERMRSQLADLAIAVVDRIAPALGADKLVPILVGEAIRQLSFEPSLLVRVHPDVADATRARLTQEGVAGTPELEIVGMPEFGAFDCVIEAEGGVVRAGLHEQLEQVRTILAAAWRETDAAFPDEPDHAAE